MLVDTYSSCDLWDIRKPLIPPRSHLHHLKPQGVGTPLGESLTGYIARLAESHCLLPGVLISKEIAPSLKKGFVKKRDSRGLRALFDRATALNGIGSIACDFAQALETLTLRKDLRFLTLLSWAEILSARGLFRTHRAWCPACYEKWYLSDQVVYEPLLWTVDAITVCPHHHQILLNHCPHCLQQQPLLTWRSRPGYCSNCGDWLGINPGNTPSTELHDEFKYQAWLVDNIGELIAVAPRLSSIPPRENIAKSLRAVVDIVSEGNVAAFARLLEIPKNTVWMWHTGKVLPQLNVLLKICYCLEISLLDFLTKEAIYTKHCINITHKSLTQKRLQRRSQKPFDSNQIQQALLSALNTKEEPPPTMKEVAERLGYNRRTIYRHFPDLCHDISTKSRCYRRATLEKKIEKSCEEVRQIALKLHKENLYPSECRVSELMTKPGYLRNKKVRVTLQEVQSELST
jgi:DNA-binding XRE family transcriptional regulator